MQDFWFHPKWVHVPMALAVLMPILALGLALAWWRGWLPARSFLIVGLFQGALFASSFVAVQTGERDEDRVERIVGEVPVEAHEEAAELFLWGAGIVWAITLVPAALARQRRLGLIASGIAIVGTLAVAALGIRVGQAGGELVYVHGACQSAVRPAVVEDD